MANFKGTLSHLDDILIAAEDPQGLKTRIETSRQMLKDAKIVISETKSEELSRR